MDENEYFYYVVDKFCQSLASLVIKIYEPTDSNIQIIKQKKYRTIRFDKYVEIIENFNGINQKLINLLKEIILSMHSLFVEKTPERLIEFLNNLGKFLIFLIEDDILVKLINIKNDLEDTNVKNVAMLDKINKVRKILFDLVTISIGISSIFIPQVSIVLPVLTIIENRSKKSIETEKMLYKTVKIDIDKIMHDILDIELRAQIIQKISKENIMESIQKQNNSHVCNMVKQLEENYLKLYQISIYLNVEISKYKQRRANGIKSTIRNLLRIM